MLEATRGNFLGSFAKDGAVTTVKILGHTGKSIVSVLETFAHDRMKAGITAPLSVQLLLRDRGVESPRRREIIAGAEKRVRYLAGKYSWLNVEVRHYSAIQTLRGTIIARVDGSKDALFSAYNWVLPNRACSQQENRQAVRTTAVEWSKTLHVRRGRPANEDVNLLNILENWFDYYWGPGIIHTIAFDFDDTLIDTFVDKIKAWIAGIDGSLETNPEWRDYFSSVFLNRFVSSPLERFDQFQELVDELAGKKEILGRILNTGSAPAAVEKYIDGVRSDVRKSFLFPPHMTEDQLRKHIRTKIFKGARAALLGLHQRGYALAVASLTDEERIETALKYADIPVIGTVVGRTEYRDRELSQHLREKIFLIRKIANLAGVPVNRVLYVGDHRMDEAAAKEVGAPFVQALMIDAITPSENLDTLRFNRYSQLASAVDKAEGRLRALETVPRIVKTY